MNDIEICEVTPCGKGRVRIAFSNGTELVLYRTEIRKLSHPDSDAVMREGGVISWKSYGELLGMVGLRAKRRAMHLLEQMDRTEQQLRDKLRQGGYSAECVEAAVEYVKSYHYIDDMRYARLYIHDRQDAKSRRRLMMELAAKGVDADTASLAMEEEFCASERGQIRRLLEKRRYDFEGSDPKERQRQYRFLLGRGYKSGDILSVMRQDAEDGYYSQLYLLP